MNEIKHYGIKGQRWGVRRFQNDDGSLKNKAKNKFKTGEQKQKKELTPEEKKARTAKGFKIAGGILGVVGTYVVADFIMSKVTGDMNLFQAGKLAAAALEAAKLPN